MTRTTIGLRRAACGHAVSALVLALLLGVTGAAGADDDGYSPEDGNACIDCHENSNVLGILETKHADADDPHSPAAQKQCQSCHGPSAKHMKFPMQVSNLHFGEASKAPVETQNTMCLECHADGHREAWSASAHGYESLRCSECHTIHQPAAIVPAHDTTTATCTDGCHGDLMAGADPATFTHPAPLKPTSEDDFTCATCHNPHGSLESGRCVDCHDLKADGAKQSEKAQRFHATADKRGVECIRCHKGLAHPIKPLETSAHPVHETPRQLGAR